MKEITLLLVTGGGKITCKRCSAKSKRSGEQCEKPTLRGKAVCEFDGGRSTGPKTEAGKARQRAAVLKTGNYTKEAIEDKARSVRVLAGLEDAMYVLNMTTTPRARGGKSLSVLARLNASRALENVETRLPLAAMPMANTDRHESFRAFDDVAFATALVDYA